MDGLPFTVIGTVLSVTTASLAPPSVTAPPAASQTVKGSDPVKDSSDTRLLLVTGPG